MNDASNTLFSQVEWIYIIFVYCFLEGALCESVAAHLIYFLISWLSCKQYKTLYCTKYVVDKLSKTFLWDFCYMFYILLKKILPDAFCGSVAAQLIILRSVVNQLIKLQSRLNDASKMLISSLWIFFSWCWIFMFCILFC